MEEAHQHQKRIRIDSELLQAKSIGRYVSSSNRWLLRDASITVCGGDAIAVVGASGSGKTLLLRALAMLDPIDEGEIIWRGNSIAARDVPGFRRQVIYLHQRPALLEGTVEESLRMPFQFQIHVNSAFNRVYASSLLSSVGRDGTFLSRQTHDLSGGEAQIVALIRALQLNPSVLLLDEPTASLDGASTEVIEQFVLKWHNECQLERALVWVTHNREQAGRIANRMVEMDSGRLSGKE